MVSMQPIVGVVCPTPEPVELNVQLLIRRHVVYVLKDADGNVLYVGYSSAFAGRLATHALDKGDDFVPATVDLYDFDDDRGAALAFEGKMIRELHPPWNANGVPPEKRVQPKYRWKCINCGKQSATQSKMQMCRACLVPLGPMFQVRRRELGRALTDEDKVEVIDQYLAGKGKPTLTSLTKMPDAPVRSSGRIVVRTCVECDAPTVQRHCYKCEMAMIKRRRNGSAR